jgi:hypothetical protein
MRVAIYLTTLLLVASCKSKEEKILVNREHDLWRVIQQGQYRSDSSLKFYKLNSDNTFNEIYFFDNKFTELNSNPDVLNWRKWKQISDSTFQIAHIDHRLLSLTDTLALFGNIKRPQDSIRLLRVKIQNDTFTSYR